MTMKAFACFLLLAALPAAAAELDYAGAKARADHDEASLSEEQLDRLVRAHGDVMGAAHSICLADLPQPDLAPYTVVLELDANGSIVHTWRQGETPLAICFERQLAGKTLYVPPTAPFYTSFEMSWTQH